MDHLAELYTLPSLNVKLEPGNVVFVVDAVFATDVDGGAGDGVGAE